MYESVGQVSFPYEYNIVCLPFTCSPSDSARGYQIPYVLEQGETALVVLMSGRFAIGVRKQKGGTRGGWVFHWGEDDFPGGYRA